MSLDLPPFKMTEGVCGICQIAKMARMPFPSQTQWRAKKKLELVHSDIFGPMSEESLSGCKYFTLFIDDLTRMCWVYFLRSKGEVFNRFVEFKAWVEKESERSVKCLRTDNALEYTSAEFTTFA